MRVLLGWLCVMMMLVATGGCKETEAAEKSSDKTVQEETTVEKTPETPAVETAKPITAAPAEMTPDTVVVTVNGTPIKNATIVEEVNKRVEVMKTRMPEGQTMTEAQQQQIRMGVEDMLVQKEVLKQQLAKKNVTVTDEEVTKQIEEIAAANGQTMDQVKEDIKNYGMTMEDLYSQVRPQVEMKKLSEAYLTDEEMLKKAKEFYDGNPSYFKTDEQVRASHVLIKVEPNATEEEKTAAKKKAEDVLAKAKAGEDFAALAKEYSDDPGSKDKGGEYTFGRGKMVKPFEEAAFSLEPGQVSGLVETQYGYHIIKLSEKIDAKTTPFEDEKEKIISFLLRKDMQENVDIKYCEAEEAMRNKAKQQQMMQQQMMQQIQQQMQQQQAQQAAEEAAQPAEQPKKEEAPAEE